GERRAASTATDPTTAVHVRRRRPHRQLSDRHDRHDGCLGRRVGGFRRFTVGASHPRAACRSVGARGIPRTRLHPRGHLPILRSEEHTSALQSRFDLVCRLLLVTKKILCLLSAYDCVVSKIVSCQHSHNPIHSLFPYTTLFRSMIGMMAALAVGWVVFGASPSGNLILVLLAAALGLVAFLALGYTLAAIYPSSGAATGIGNVLMLLLMLSSGAFVPLATMPEGVQTVMNFSPVRHFAVLMQGLWEGQPWSSLLLPTGILVAMVIVFGALGSILFRWE